MKTKLSIKLKSAFLLAVFLLNTVVVLACSLEMDMKSNVSHHHEEAKTETVHSHSEAKNHHHAKEDKDNCCKDEAVKFAKVNKLTPLSADFVFHPSFFPVALIGFNSYEVSEAIVSTSNKNFYFLTHHPPIPDIRVAIQSFQI